jgi:hypothetical protein
MKNIKMGFGKNEVFSGLLSIFAGEASWPA